MDHDPFDDGRESSNLPERTIPRREFLLAAAAGGTGKKLSKHFPGGRPNTATADAVERQNVVNVAGDLWAGPEAVRPSTAEEGWYYIATDSTAEYYSTGDGWIRQRERGAVRQEQAGRVVTTRRELHETFDTLSSGDTVYIDGENAPYRTIRWLDIDVDGVTVVGPGIKQLIMPADGANVGGFRIGHNTHCENIRIRGVGYHGNPEGQSPAAFRLHGFVVRDVSNVTLQENYVTRTHPYHVHNWGGSGFSIEKEARHVAILRNRIHDIGDRGIQMGCDHVVVHGNVGTKGFDRTIATNYYEPFASYGTQYATITNNLSDEVRTGSAIGVDGGTRKPSQYVTVTGNVGFEPAHRLVFVKPNCGQIAITGNVGFSTTAPPSDIAGIHVVTGRPDVVVTNNVVVGWRKGIWASTRGPVGTRFRDQTIPVNGYVISGNRVRGPAQEGIRVEGENGVVANNSVQAAGLGGIVVANARGCQVNGNTVRESGGHGLRVESTASHCRVDGNVLGRNNRLGERYNEIHVGASSTQVSNNYVVERGGAWSVFERDGADRNYFASNRVPVDGRSWSVSGLNSVVEGGFPAFDLHRDVDAADGSVDIDFAKPYAEQPFLVFGRRGGGIREIAYRRDDDGRYTGARITVGSDEATVDVSVSGRAGG